MDILCLKLKKDLKTALESYSNEKGYLVEDLDVLIDESVKPELFNYKIREYSETDCQARLWAKGLQCGFSKVDGCDYCNKHHDMMRVYGTLRFGDIKDKKPKYDLIKLKLGKNERLNWIEPCPLTRLQNLLDKQACKMSNTHKLVIS